MLRVIAFLDGDLRLALAGLVCFGAGLAAMHLFHRWRAAAPLADSNRRLRSTLDNLAQGVTLYDAQARLVLCNERYIEMYGLSRDVIKPGATIQEMVQHRIERGVLFISDPEKYVADIVRSAKTIQSDALLAELNEVCVVLEAACDLRTPLARAVPQQ